MINKNYIKDISEVFGIPKSTLRYWHSEGLVHFDRDSTNDYRKFSVRTIVDIGDIAFYRGLNIPIDELKHLQEKNVDELENTIKNSAKNLEAQILLLKESMKKIDTRIERINQYKELLEQPYSLSEPNFKKMVRNDLQQSYYKKFLIDPYIGGILIPSKDREKFEFTFIAGDEQEDEDLIWNVDDSTKKFIRCLIKADNYWPDATCLDEHREYFDRHGYEMGDVVARYLFTAFDQKLYDYHEAWIEIRSS